MIVSPKNKVWQIGPLILTNVVKLNSVVSFVEGLSGASNNDKFILDLASNMTMSGVLHPLSADELHGFITRVFLNYLTTFKHTFRIVIWFFFDERATSNHKNLRLFDTNLDELEVVRIRFLEVNGSVV